MSGKWHLGYDHIGGWGPWDWGFTHSFGITAGMSNHWNGMAAQPNSHDPKVQEMLKNNEMPKVGKAQWYLDGELFDRPDGVYSNDIYTEKMLGFIDKGRESGKPWLG